jgi:uncharacterized protein (TIGR02452 family)
MLMDRNLAADLGRETVRILEAGRYQSPAGKTVPIGDLLRRAVQGTRSYPPDQALPEVPAGSKPARIEVENETTLTAARCLVEAGLRPLALNFASATNPGGGFLGGARAQEESIARSSGLYACLVGQAMYEFHRARHDPMYSHYAIYSPDVPVFRTDDGTLLEEPYLCSFITCPAVNAKVVREGKPAGRAEIRETMRDRMAKVLAIAALQGYDTLVLGAWGCGAFGNDSQEVAELFREALTGRFGGVFLRAVFAITDWSEDSRFIGPFRGAFGDQVVSDK